MITTKRLTLLALTAGAVALVSGCERTTTTVQTAPGTTTTTTTVKPTANVERALDKAGDAVGDAAITGKIKTAMLLDPDVKALKIDVDTRNGAVTLTGVVDDRRNVDRAATIARGIDGVKSVDNRLTIKAPG